MKRIYILTTLLAGSMVYAGNTLLCKVAPISLYSTVTHNTARIKSHRTYSIEAVYLPNGTVATDKLLVNKKVFDLYKRADGITTYIRGKYLIYHSKGRYYIKKVGTTHTGRMNCKESR